MLSCWPCLCVQLSSNITTYVSIKCVFVNMSNNSADLLFDDFGKVCRTCLAPLVDGEMKNLYENCISEQCLVEMLMTVTFVEFAETDKLPFQICLNCENEVIRSYKFAQKCLEVDKKLKNHLNKISLEKEIEFENTAVKPEIEIEEHTIDPNFETCLIKPEHENEEYTNLDRFDENSFQSANSDSSNKTSDANQEKSVRKPVKPNTKELGPPYECKKCYKTFPSTKLLWIHYQQEKHPRNARIECKVCSKSIQCAKMSTHLKLHSPENGYVCDICGKRFGLKANLRRHSMIHSGEKPHKCPHCNKTFIQLVNLQHHVVIHSGIKAFTCEHCGSNFTSKGSLGTHLKNRWDGLCYQRPGKGQPTGPQRKTKPPLEHECDICNKKFYTKSLLSQHNTTHGEKKFLCSLCGRGFYRQVALDSHLNIHTGYKPFSCDICGKKFSQAGSLNTHKLLHSGTKPFVCSICDRKFTQRHHVTYHMRTHSGDKPHKCKICGKSFALNGNLKVHIRTHTGETPYLCPICGKGFYDSSSMKKHKLAHGKQNKIVN